MIAIRILKPQTLAVLKMHRNLLIIQSRKADVKFSGLDDSDQIPISTMPHKGQELNIFGHEEILCGVSKSL